MLNKANSFMLERYLSFWMNSSDFMDLNGADIADMFWKMQGHIIRVFIKISKSRWESKNKQQIQMVLIGSNIIILKI